MTANVVDEKRRAARRKLDRARQQRAKPRRGLVAEQLVRDWSPEQRHRIRARAFDTIWANPPGMALCDTPEYQLVALIDQISAEEARLG